MFKRAFGTVAGLAMAMTGSAWAADFVETPMPPSWTAFYIGVGGGGAWADYDVKGKYCPYDESECYKTDVPFLDNLLDDVDGDSAARGVVQAGLDFELAPSFVLGLMGDFNFGNNIGFGRHWDYDYGPVTFYDKFSYGIDNMWTVAGRAGWAMDNILFYGLVGYTWADADAKFDYFCLNGDCAENFKNSTNLDGVTYGGGIEVKGVFVHEDLSARLEYRYTSLEGAGISGYDEDDNFYKLSAEQDVQGIYLTFNWRLGDLLH